MPLGMEVGLYPNDIVLHGDPALPPKMDSPGVFGLCLLWLNGCMHQDTTLYGGRPQPRRRCVRWGPSSPPPKGHSPQFSSNVRCSQTAGWTKMPLGNLVWRLASAKATLCLMGTQLPRKKGHSLHPIFGPCLLLPNGWMDEDTTWYGSRPRPRPHCVRQVSSSPAKGAQQPPSFRPMSICDHGRPSQLLLNSCTAYVASREAMSATHSQMNV